MHVTMLKPFERKTNEKKNQIRKCTAPKIVGVFFYWVNYFELKILRKKFKNNFSKIKKGGQILNG